jgi:hypothetical protein
MKLFNEEQQVLDSLLSEWYVEVERFHINASTVFKDKGKMYDRESPVWERIAFPEGFVQELRKKIDRLRQLFAVNGLESIRWDEVLEELKDIHNYSAMCGAIVVMKQGRMEDEPEYKGMVHLIEEQQEELKGGSQ